MKTKNKILFVAEDPGGFNAIYPVISEMKSQNYNIFIILGGASRSIARNHNTEFEDYDDLSDEELESHLDNKDIDIVVAGSSNGLSLDKKVIGWAKKNKIKTVYVMDYWSNYNLRFSNPGTNDLAYLPDAICVIDKFMEGQLLKKGFNKNIIYKTGNPFFDTFGEISQNEENYIVFASQPFSEITDKERKNRDTYSFNEIEIFRDVVEEIEKEKIEMPMILSLHPKCKNKDKFNNVIKKSSLRIEISNTDTNELIKSASLVIGISTMVLFNASLLGKVVLSYQPGITKEEDTLMSNRLGLSKAVYNKNELGGLINSAFLNKDKMPNLKSAREKYIKQDSTGRVIEVILNTI